jgi:ribosomal-protein-alanine N-acetyltransferase
MLNHPDHLTTRRLLLRPYHDTDVEQILAYATDEAWSRYLPVPVPYARTDAEQFVSAMRALDHLVHWAWAIVHDEVVVGGINIRFLHEGLIGEMGWSVAPRLWGRGLATEAAQVVLDTAFTTSPALQRVRAMADARNVASQRVMEKIGLRREGTLRQNRLTRGELIDEVWYGVLRVEWEVRLHAPHRDAGPTPHRSSP